MVKGTTKPVMGRPTKLTEDLLTKFQEVLDDKQNALLCTDEELLMLLNEKLSKDEQISEDSFQRYKSGTLDSNKDLLANFCGLYKRALLKQRDDLFLKLKDDEKAWQRWAWIIERKFDNWNIRNKQEHSGGVSVNVQTVSFKDIPKE